MKKTLSVLFLFFLIGALPSGRCAAQDFRYFLDTLVATNYGPNDLCFNPVRHKIYVALSDTVLGVIDGQYNYSTVSGFNYSYPRYPEYNRNRDVVYAAGSHWVYLVDGQTNAIVDSTANLSEGFNDLLYDSICNRLYAAGTELSILNGTSNALLKIYPNYNHRLFHYRPTDKVLAQSSYSDSLLVLRDTTRLAEVRVPGMDYLSRFAANEARGKIYVSLPGINQVAILDAASHAVTRTVWVAAGPSSMAYCPASDEVYVACQRSDSLTVIRGSDDSVSCVFLGLNGDSVSSVIYNRFINRIYCADENNDLIRIVNPTTKAVEGTIYLPTGQTYRPVVLLEGDSGRVFTANSWNNSIAVVAWEDSTIPYIMWTDPYDSATGIAFDAPVQVFFSEPIDPASLAFTCSPDPGGWTAEWDVSQRLVTLRHRYFATNVQHTFTVTAARDLWGNNLASGYSPNPWRFTVRPLDVAAYPWQRGRYQLISVPLRLYDSLATSNFWDDLGAYGPSGWRLFGYDPGSGSNIETPPLMPGRGYWLSSVNSCTLDASGYRLPKMSHETRLSLTTGWNLIGCPYDTVLSLSGLMVIDTGGLYIPFWDSLANAVLRQRLWVYWDSTYDFRNDGTWDRDTLTPLDSLDRLTPWLGYAAYAVRPCSLRIQTPINKDTEPLIPKICGKPAELDWSLEIRADISGWAGERVRLGISPQALPGYDRLDGERPPPVWDAVELYIPHADWGPGTWHQYSSDFRPGAEYLEWPLVLKMSDQSQEAVLTFRLEGRLPSGYRLYLMERDMMRAMEITGQGQTGFTGGRDLAVVLSNQGPGQLPFAPLSFELGMPRPNPSNQITRVSYQITKAGLVRLTVYNALGQKVRTIAEGPKAPGYYSACWDGRDDGTALSPPGVYFIKLEAEGRQAVKKLVRVR